MVTVDELDDISRASRLPVIVISGSELTAETRKDLRLQWLRVLSDRTRWGDNFYVYQRWDSLSHD
jgi:hypothetical protein